uniref:Peptidase S1 domain-containing protein n=1 Tax=Pelusios castaneus TaxID=367368 RepID=A0A8C8SWI7_9SAUR
MAWPATWSPFCPILLLAPHILLLGPSHPCSETMATQCPGGGSRLPSVTSPQPQRWLQRLGHSANHGALPLKPWARGGQLGAQPAAARPLPPSSGLCKRFLTWLSKQRPGICQPQMHAERGWDMLSLPPNQPYCCRPHCSYSDPKMWVAFLGTAFLSGMDGRVEKIFRIYKHPFYNIYTLDYDVALLELATSVRFTSAIKPICLPDNSHVFREGARCFITGWGATKEGGMAQGHGLCLAGHSRPCTLSTKFYPIQISSRMVCAGFPQGAIDSCSGDAGGPLACREPSGRWFLAGITSWGYGCARPHFPGVYTKVTAVRGWIGQNLKL